MKYVSLDELPHEGVSHNPEIRKQVMLRHGELEHLTNFSQSRFRPGQVCAPHRHATMHEVYLVQQGTGTITIEGRAYRLAPGVCVAVEAGEEHSVANDGAEVLVLTYFGIAVDG